MSYMERLGKMFVFVLAVLFLSFQNSSFAQEYNNKDAGNSKKSGSEQKNQESQFQRTAKDLTLKLSREVNLSKDQSDKVSNILVDLQKDVADKMGGNNSSENVGSSRSDSKFRDADVSANDKIENIITDKEIPAYMKVKKEWWAKIKDKVYSENYAQNEEQPGNKTVAEGKKTRKGTDRNDVVGSSRSDKADVSGENKDKDNPQFEQFAKDMSVDLMRKLDLSLEKAADIEDVLINYQKNIADAEKDRMNENRSNVAMNSSVKSRSNQNSRDENVGSSRNSNMSNEIQSAIRSADDKVKDVLNDNQKTKYDRVKKQWWKDVQSRVSSSVRHYERTNK
ncbi:MAG TPA: hypothetical protein VHO03_09790 [Ignavibacteriales bacterium]|nr:hypothetical protein [Ignavibacteriales bacterium]